MTRYKPVCALWRGYGDRQLVAFTAPSQVKKVMQNQQAYLLAIMIPTMAILPFL